MDSKLEKALEISNLMATIANQKRILKEEYFQSLYFYQNGGTFLADTTTITYVKTIKDISIDDQAVIIDTNGAPIRIDNLEEFLEKLINRHVQSNNKYFADYEKLRQSRKIESILEK